MKYIVVQDVTTERLEATVNALLGRGWTLVGSVCVVNSGMGLRWGQAMIEAAEAAGE